MKCWNGCHVSLLCFNYNVSKKKKMVMIKLIMNSWTTRSFHNHYGCEKHCKCNKQSLLIIYLSPDFFLRIILPCLQGNIMLSHLRHQVLALLLLPWLCGTHSLLLENISFELNKVISFYRGQLKNFLLMVSKRWSCFHKSTVL